MAAKKATSGTVLQQHRFEILKSSTQWCTWSSLKSHLKSQPRNKQSCPGMQCMWHIKMSNLCCHYWPSDPQKKTLSVSWQHQQVNLTAGSNCPPHALPHSTAKYGMGCLVGHHMKPRPSSKHGHDKGMHSYITITSKKNNLYQEILLSSFLSWRRLTGHPERNLFSTSLSSDKLLPSSQGPSATSFNLFLQSNVKKEIYQLPNWCLNLVFFGWRCRIQSRLKVIGVKKW